LLSIMVVCNTRAVSVSGPRGKAPPPRPDRAARFRPAGNGKARGEADVDRRVLLNRVLGRASLDDSQTGQPEEDLPASHSVEEVATRRPRQGAPRSVLPALVTVAETDYSPFRGEVVKGNVAALSAWRSSGRLHLPALLIDRHAHDLVQGRRRLGLLRRAEAQVLEDSFRCRSTSR
jgi:hypothetical protein